MKRITLEIQYADKRTEMKQLEDGTYIIGRDTGDIVLRSSLVSGRHGELKVSGSRVVYTDQGSTNGTFAMDGSRLSGPLQMTAGTGLRIGECKVILKAIHVLTSKTVMQPSVKPAFSSTKTVLGQPAMIPPPASVPPAQPAQAAASQPAQAMPRSAQARPSASPAAAPSSATSVPPAASAPPPAASVPPSAAATEPAPPPYAADAAPEPSVDAASAEPAAAAQADAGLVQSAAPAQSAGSVGGGDFTGSYSYKMDFSGIIKAPMDDQGWLMKCLIIGLMSIVPIAGSLNLMGWMMACYRNRKAGSQELAEAKFAYIGDGFGLFLSFLPIMVIAFIPVLGLVAMAASPAVMYLAVVKGEKMAGLKFGAILAFIKANTQSYIQLLIAFVVAGFIAGLGSAIFVGALLTVPFGMAMNAVILSEIKEE